jgi:hypothetical protein
MQSTQLAYQFAPFNGSAWIVEEGLVGFHILTYSFAVGALDERIYT